MEFGLLLNNMRKGANLSQEQMAVKLLKARSSVSKLETNNYELKAGDLIKWIHITESEISAASFILGINDDILKQALEVIETRNELDELLNI